MVDESVFLVDSDKDSFISSLQKKYLTGRLGYSYTVYINNYVFVLDISNEVISAEGFSDYIGGYVNDAHKDV